MQKTGIPLDIEDRQLFLVREAPRGRAPYFWDVWIVQGERFLTHLILSGGKREPKKIAENIRSDLYNYCSSRWLDEEFAETEALVIALVEEVQNFERLILNSQLSDVQVKAAFLDISKALRVQIQASMFQLVRARRPVAAALVLEEFRALDPYELPDWTQSIP